MFIGGSTAWKMNTMVSWAALARERGAWCHVARVNTPKRIRKVALAGATSFDGSSATRYLANHPKLDRAVAQQFMILEDKTK